MCVQTMTSLSPFSAKQMQESPCRRRRVVQNISLFRSVHKRCHKSVCKGEEQQVEGSVEGKEKRKMEYWEIKEEIMKIRNLKDGLVRHDIVILGYETWIDSRINCFFISALLNPSQGK